MLRPKKQNESERIENFKNNSQLDEIGQSERDKQNPGHTNGSKLFKEDTQKKYLKANLLNKIYSHWEIEKVKSIVF